MDPRLSPQYQNPTMASPPPAKDIGRRLPPPYLSPPEEATLSNFSKDANPSPAHKAWQHTLPPIQTVLSPPASPSASPRTTLPHINPDRSQASAAHDPPLFSHSQSDDNAAPLFDDNRLGNPDFTTRTDSLSPERNNQKPRKIFARYLHDFDDSTTPALDYWRMNLNEASKIPGFGQKKQAAMHPPVVNTRLDAYTASIKHSLDHPSKAGVTKSRPTPPKPKAPKPAKVALPSTPRKAPRVPAVQRESKSQSVEPQTRKRAPPTKSAPLKEEDKDWAQLPDYTPPTSTLDNGAKPLKVTWKGSPNDLRNDPAAAHMHPQEVEAAAELKLFGAQYLANKRRIFEAKVKSLKEGKNFTKTAAQQACNIDVNKTSKMWEAFDKSGWFDREHFEKWL